MSIIRIGQSHYAPDIDEEKCVSILSSERTPFDGSAIEAME